MQFGSLIQLNWGLLIKSGKMAKLENEEDLEENLTRLERRICFLERIVMGSRFRGKSEPNLVDPLLETINKLRSLTVGREKYNTLSKKMQELGPYVEKIDQFGDGCEPDLVRWELILAQEDKIRKRASMMDNIVSQSKVIDSEVIKDLDPFRSKLEKLREIAVSQEQEASTLSAETQNLIENYNRLLTRIKGRLVAWDKKILVLEGQKKDRKLKDLIPEFD